MLKITFEDKITKNVSTVEDKYKITADNVNEIKNAVNENADILSEAQDKITNIENDISDINFMTVSLSDDCIIGTDDEDTILPLSNVLISRGTNLSLNSDGCIVIGAGVNHVRVSGNIYLYTGTINNVKTGCIQKNTAYQIVVNTDKINREYIHIPIPLKIIKVEEGDIISLLFQGKANDLIKSYGHGTFLTVDVID